MGRLYHKWWNMRKCQKCQKSSSILEKLCFQTLIMINYCVLNIPSVLSKHLNTFSKIICPFWGTTLEPVLKDSPTQNKLLGCCRWLDWEHFHNMENIKQMSEQLNVSMGSMPMWWGALRVSLRLALPDILWLPFALMLVLLVFI